MGEERMILVVHGVVVFVFDGVGEELLYGRGAYRCTMNRWDDQT
jgi:hypothetical protein